MSATLLYHMMGVRGYSLVKENKVPGGMEFTIKCRRLECPCCGSAKVWRKGSTTRRFRSVPVGKKTMTILIDVPRVYCLDCQVTKPVRLSFVKGSKRYTRFLATYALDLLQSMTCQDVARHLGMTWDTVREIEQEHLERHYAKPPLKEVTHIAIDEIAVGKGHKYLTVVMDLKEGRAIFVGDGKDADALLPFWKRLRRSRAKIVAVATDMSPAYTAAVRTHLPDAIHVFDRFHIMKLFNSKLTALRSRLYREMQDPAAKSALKGIRFALLKRDPDEKCSEKLETALTLSADLSAANVLKEQLYDLWEAEDEAEALELLAEWLADADWSQIPEMQAFAKTLRRYWREILNYYEYEITSGPLEGLNNKIKTLKRQSYGFRNQNYFKVKILAIHQSRYTFVG